MQTIYGRGWRSVFSSKLQLHFAELQKFMAIYLSSQHQHSHYDLPVFFLPLLCIHPSVSCMKVRIVHSDKQLKPSFSTMFAQAKLYNNHDMIL